MKQDTQRFGRCFILSPSIEQSQYGIKTIELHLRVGGTIFIHNIGMRKKGVQQAVNSNSEANYKFSFD